MSLRKLYRLLKNIGKRTSTKTVLDDESLFEHIWKSAGFVLTKKSRENLGMEKKVTIRR
jgi:predicted hydrocarbon binding protein